MIRITLVMLFFLLPILGAKLEVTADKFNIDNNRRVTTFQGSVTIKQNKDEIKAENIYVYTDEDNNPIRFEAVKNVHFIIYAGEKKYLGECNSLVYQPLKDEYTLFGKVKLNQSDNSEVLMGEKIVINSKTQKAEVLGGEKPVKLIFGKDD